jgi:hypothetical protein
MKKHIQVLILLGWLILIPFALQAQVPPHPNGGGGPGGGNTPVGGGAPLDGGIGLMIILSAAYAMRKRLNGSRED